MDDIVVRRSVWLALSELYLDTELQDEDYARIAEVLHASGFSLEEVEAIHRYEVCPVLEGNLWSVAGEWAGFDEAWLYERCTRSFRRRHKLWYRLSADISYYFTGRAVWKLLAERLRQ